MTHKNKTGILLINLGTPDEPTPKAVKRYLKEFLFDPKVIQIPAIPRWILVNLVITPFRSKTSAQAYQQVWLNEKNKKGSPLKYYSESLVKQMRGILTKEESSSIQIEYAMRYQNPSILKSLKSFDTKNLDKLIIIPLFPQYSEAATGSAIEKTIKTIKYNYPNLKDKLNIIENFFDHPEFISATTKNIESTLKIIKKTLSLIFIYSAITDFRKSN